MATTCKFYKYKQYASYDSGVTWIATGEYDRGELYEANSSDCGYVPNYKFSGTYYGGETYSIDCDDDKFVDFNDTHWSPALDFRTMTSAVVGDCVTKLFSTFVSCSALTSVTLPDTIVEIQAAFSNCHNLKSIDIPNSVSGLTWSTFSICTSLTSVIIPDNVLKMDDNCFNGCTSLSSVTIGSGLTTLNSRVFLNCSSLTSIDIPDTITAIESSAFTNCTSLESVKLPANLQTICAYTFSNCTSLKSIDIPNTIINISYNAFEYSGLKNVTIPDSVSFIGNECFMGCTSLSSVTIGSGITYIRHATFSGCTSLSDIIIPNTVTRVGDFAFANCFNLTSIDILDGVESIDGYAFYSATSLTSVTLPSSTTFVGDKAFSNCSNLKYVVIEAVNPPSSYVGYVMFENTNCPIYVPCDSVGRYKTANGWSRYADRIQGYNDIRTITGTPYCINYDKYIDVYDQVKGCDSGSDWDTIATTSTLLEINSDFCGYHPTPPHDYSQDYLTFVTQDSDVTFWTRGAGGSSKQYSYSLDSGATWTELPTYSTSSAFTVSANHKVMWKGDTFGHADTTYFASSGGTWIAEGNVMSLIYGDDFSGQTDLGRYSVLGELFRSCSGLTSAENLILPATAMTGNYGYRYMFGDCTNLTTAPELPATTLTDYCYESMFQGCTSLRKAPVLSATTLASNCYGNMFNGCTNLNIIICLATDITANNCTSNWVYGVPNNGTFIKAANMNDWARGDDGIPYGWTVTNYSN